MYPILYDIDATTYKNNMGKGVLADAISCEVSIVHNDANTLVLKYPTGGNLADELTGGKVIAVQSPNWIAPQPYYINKVSKPRNGIITVHAWHASYRLSGVMVKPFTSNRDLSLLLLNISDNIVGNGGFTFLSDDYDVAASYTLEKTSTLRAVLADIAGKFGYTLSFVHFFSSNDNEDIIQVHIYTHTEKRESPLYEGIDIDKAVYDYDATNAYEGVYPYWKKNDVTVYSDTIIPANLPAYARAIPLDLSSSFDTQPTQAQLAQAGQAFLARGTGNPVSGWTITSNTNVQDINVGDIVDVVLSDGTVVENSIESATFDALAERYTKITLGNARKTLYKAISGSASGGSGGIGSGSAQGPKGDKGDKGDKGADGVSPTVTTTAITGGTEVTITDATGAHSFDVMDGATGAKGATGTAAYNYYMVLSDTSVKKTGNTYAPASITMSGKRSQGTKAPANYAGRFIVEVLVNGTWSTAYTSTANEATHTYTLDTEQDISAVRISMYLAGGVTTILDTQTVAVVSDGAKGDTGAQGAKGDTGADGDSAYELAVANGWDGDYTHAQIHYSVTPEGAQSTISAGEPIKLESCNNVPLQENTIVIAVKGTLDYVFGLYIIGYGKLSRNDDGTYDWHIDTSKDYRVITDAEDAWGAKTDDELLSAAGMAVQTDEAAWLKSLAGADGMDGKDGAKGDTGAQGQKGDTGAKGDTGTGIASVEKISTTDNIDTYRINLTDNTHYDYQITNGVDGEDGETPTVEVGVRNLLLDSEAERTSPESADNSAYVPNYIVTDYGKPFVSNTTQVLTVSAEYEVVDNTADGAYIYALCNGTSINGSKLVNYYGDTKSVVDYIDVNNQRGVYRRSFTLTDEQAANTNNKSIRLRLRYADNGAKLKIKNVKLEIGNRATDYIPAPEDNDTDVTAITTAEIDAIAI